MLLLAAGALHSVAAAWWVVAMMPGSSSGGPPPPPRWSPSEEQTMRKSTTWTPEGENAIRSFSETMADEMREEALKAAKAAAAQITDALSADELLRAKKKVMPSSPTKTGPAPQKPGLVVVHEDAEVLEFDVSEDTKRQRLGSVSKGTNVDETASTYAPSDASSEIGTAYVCMNCKEEVYKSGFLLCDNDMGSHDWAGTLWGTCEECSDYPNNKNIQECREICVEEAQRRVPDAAHSLAEACHEVQRGRRLDQDAL